MRRQRGGKIINISSIGGLIGIPFQGMYSGSKFAIEGMTESLRMEVATFGIRVVLIEPGDFRTQITTRRVRTSASATTPAYRKRFTAALGVIEHDENNGLSPMRIARLVHRILRGRSNRFRYLIGPLPEIIAARMKPLLPYKIFERIIKTYYKLM